MSPRIAVPSLLAAALAACGPSKATPATPLPGQQTPAGEDPATDLTGHAEPQTRAISLAEAGIDAASMDPAADPCVDFYRYACGGWMDETEIPDDKSVYGRFSEIHERNESLLKGILEKAAAGADDPFMSKLGAFYGACMDEEAIEKAGLSGIAPLRKAIAGVKDQKSLVAALTALHRHGIWAGFSHEPYADFKDSTANILYLDTGALGLPDRDYYLRNDEPFPDTRAFYEKHVADMLQLAGKSRAQARRDAKAVVALETELAKVTRTRVERRDVEKLYNPVKLEGLVKMTPGFPWATYFGDLGHPGLAGGDVTISVTTPEYMERLDTLLKKTRPASWRAYLEWTLLNATAETLPKKFVEQHFALTARLSGQKSDKERWKRCVDATGKAMGDYLSQPYVKQAFGPESKQAVELMAAEMGQAFSRRLDEIDWMAEETKAQARAKLAKVSPLIGYPATWKSYDFEVGEVYAANVLAARAFNDARDLKKAGTPVDRSEWMLPAYIVNAYYSPSKNQIAFPAGILQPPFYGKDRSIAANLGALGMVVGHELTHGFDDSGARFDGEGNLRNWWQPADEEKFKEKGQCMVEQYEKYEALPGMTLNGRLTLGENIADLGGTKLAFRAYRNLRKDAAERFVAGEQKLSEDQVFFLGVGQAWCSEIREEEARKRVVTDPHSPPRFRVNGTLANMDEFAEAFSCAQGQPMRPANQCEVW